ncbi:MAG: class I SAM-dependent methyltransferase [Nitrospira sp.]|nr:class I SAM-dependent methyltransferase [Nitrospira sp.]
MQRLAANSMFLKILSHPLIRGLSVDDPRTTLLRRNLIKEKTFLRMLYSEWYERILNLLPEKTDVLELGSGAGFLQEIIPGVITSEVFETPGVNLITDACDLPFPDQSLSAIVMTDVFHHIPDVGRFFLEATRCIRPGGKIVMIEPWCTSWSEWVYTHFHPEPFSPNSGWEIPCAGPLSGANGALPWIIFQRDKALFEARYPQWRLKTLEPMMPFSYLLSGGVSMRSLVPGWMYHSIRALEQALSQRHWAMFALIELEVSS